jgi:hypothetical protein
VLASPPSCHHRNRRCAFATTAAGLLSLPPPRCRQAAASAAFTFVFIVVVVTVIIANSNTIAADAFS